MNHKEIAFVPKQIFATFETFYMSLLLKDIFAKWEESDMQGFEFHFVLIAEVNQEFCIGSKEFLTFYKVTL